MQVLDQQTTRNQTAWWLRLTRIAAVSFVIWAVALQLGAGFLDPLLTGFALMFLSSLWWHRAERRRRVVVFTILATVTMAINMVFGNSDFSHPESAGSFVPQLFVTVALALALIGAVGLLARADDARAPTVLAVGVGVFLLGLTVSLSLSANAPSDAVQPTDVIVDAQGFAWAPAEVLFDPSQHDGLWVDNRDMAHHILAVPELGIEVDVPALKARRVDVGEVAPGEYQMVCTIPGHEAMTGTLSVGS